MNSLSLILRAARESNPHATFERLDETGGTRGAFGVHALDQLADHYAARWRDAGLPRGSSTLMLGAPEPQGLAAIAGALRAGLDLTLAGPALDVAAIVALGNAREATVLAGPGEFAGLDVAGRLFEVAALNEDIRLVALYGLSRAGALALDAPLDQERDADAEPHAEPDPQVDAARAWIAAAGVNTGDTIISTASLGGAAGLTVGAFAPLLAGANLIWQAPFAALGLFEALARSASAHLVVRAAIAGDLAAAGLLSAASLASLTLIAPEGAALPDLSSDLGVTPIIVLRERQGRPLRLESVTGEKKPR